MLELTVLSNYTCASAPKQYYFAFKREKHEFQNFSQAFKGCSSPSRSNSGYQLCFVNTYNEKLSQQLNVNPCRFEIGEQELDLNLSTVQADALQKCTDYI
jgi:hypothetical protein